MSLDQINAKGAWRLLQTHLLWYRESQVYGDHTQFSVCEQVCLLLEVGSGCGPVVGVVMR